VTLQGLYDKLTPAQQVNVHVVNNGGMVVFDNGTKILVAYLDQNQNVIPANWETGTALNALG